MKKLKELTIDTVIKKYLSFFLKYGITELGIRNSYFKESASGATNVKDFVWNLFQTLLADTAKQSKTESELYSYHRDIYFQMLLFRRKHDKAKANDLLQLFFDAEIKRNLCETNLQLNVIVISGVCCESCDALNKKTYSPEDVLTNKYLGSNNCSNPKGCNCTYSFVAVRDSNGRLIINR